MDEPAPPIQPQPAAPPPPSDRKISRALFKMGT
jgi:hypothetical protein